MNEAYQNIKRLKIPYVMWPVNRQNNYDGTSINQ